MPIVLRSYQGLQREYNCITIRLDLASVVTFPGERARIFPKNQLNMSDLVQRKNVSDLIAAKIKDYILEQGLQQGDRLPTEHELAERFGVSRISVREATKALGFLGIIDAAPRRGLTIGAVNMDRLSQYLGFHFAIAQYPFDQIIDARIAIEVGGIARAVKHIEADRSIHKQLTALAEKLSANAQTDEPEGWGDLDLEFHRVLLSASGLKPLMAFHDLLVIFFNHILPHLPQDLRQRAAGEHHQLLELISQQDVAGVQEQLRVHITGDGMQPSN